MRKFNFFDKSDSLNKDVKTIEVVASSLFTDWLDSQTNETQAWVKAMNFTAESGTCLLVPGKESGLSKVVWGMQVGDDPWKFASIRKVIPEGYYQIDASSLKESYPWHTMFLAWGLAGYQFSRYKLGKNLGQYLLIPESSAVNSELLISELQATYLVRDLVNTPAEDCHPDFIESVVKDIARNYQAECWCLTGKQLIDKGYPLVHAVGRASIHEPKVLGLQWGKQTHPRLVLVGKGVCFDSGGLQIKPHQSMATMKKDMGGAAHMLALAQMIMQHKVPVRLELLIAAVENSVAGNAFRPGDVFFARNGVSVEIGHTDAEGRLLLADLLSKATENPSDLIIDYATLTGAQRVALGPEIPAIFTDSQAESYQVLEHSQKVFDPLWPLPLYTGYVSTLNSDVADISSTGSMPLGGAITAALFLKRFTKPERLWMHIDGGAYNLTSKPGRPKGGEAMGIRALFSYLQSRYA